MAGSGRKRRVICVVEYQQQLLLNGWLDITKATQLIYRQSLPQEYIARLTLTEVHRGVS